MKWSRGGPEGMQQNSTKRKTVALVLSGGAARGLAHIGVLSILEEYGVPIDFIVSASFGSIVAGYYGNGYSTSELVRRVKEFKLRTVKEGRRKLLGLISGDRAEEIFRRDLNNICIENLKLPVFILTWDIAKGEMVVLEEGSLAAAMRASSSFPGLIHPYFIDDHIYVDGGILNSMLLSIAQERGAELIIYSDVSIFSIVYKKKWLNMLVNIGLKSFRVRKWKKMQNPKKITPLRLFSKVLSLVEKHKKQCELYRRTLPDFLIEPELNGIKPLDFEKADLLYMKGREAALKQVHDILKQY
jgi:predicted acylesterase/phospholipase RssA